ncbi:hypothetical protein [Thermohalobaculum xanthum]|uniref:hypothetical protein n=1 Tax=Thermohalobaculum xanthum TaxID=2753746 RepID=UPI001F280D46|nr:hypothetical protein [Thermohalobaculum xanthum]
MHPDLEVSHRVLRTSYRRYIDADRAFQRALEMALAWFPGADTHGVLMIGDPGSRLRSLYENRDRALARLQLARATFKQRQAGLARKTVITASTWTIN